MKKKKIVLAVVASLCISALVATIVLLGGPGNVPSPSDGSNETTIDVNYLNNLVSIGKIDVVYSEDGYARLIDGAFTDISVNSSEDALRVFNQVSPALGSGFNADIADISYQASGAGTDFVEHFYRYSPTVNGIQVYGDQIILSTTESGTVTGLYSTYNTAVESVDTNATIDENTAINCAWEAILEDENVKAFINEHVTADMTFKDIAAAFKSSMDVSTNLLVYAADSELPPALVFAVSIRPKVNTVENEDKDGTLVPTDTIIEIDSHSETETTELSYILLNITYYVYANGENAGEIYLNSSNIQDWSSINMASEDANGDSRIFIAQEKDGKFRLRDATRNIETYKTTYGNILWIEPKLPGKLEEFTSSINSSAVSVHANMAEVYDYYYQILGRKSYDGNGGKIISSYDYKKANVIVIGDTRNAYWDGTAQQFLFGNKGNFGSALDVVAHEFTHAVINHVIGDGHEITLTYQGESGALNEAYADIMGNLVENKADDGLWLLGEDSEKVVRNMANPSAYNQPEHYSNRHVGAYDYGGVHINSGIFNHAAYLMITDTRTNMVSKETWAKVFYNSLFRLTCDAVFTDARGAIVNTARELGFTPEQLTAITDSFDAVGICYDIVEPPVTEPAIPEPPTNNSVLFGKWVLYAGGTDNGNGIATDRHVFTIELKEDGTAIISSGVVNSEYYSYYQGTWTATAKSPNGFEIRFDVSGGNIVLGQEPQKQERSMTIEATVENNTMQVKKLSGDDIDGVYSKVYTKDSNNTTPPSTEPPETQPPVITPPVTEPEKKTRTVYLLQRWGDTTYIYDNNGFLTSVSSASNIDVDNSGQLLAVHTPWESQYFTYNENGRVVEARWSGEFFDSVTEYFYDTSGNIVEEYYEGVYDSSGRKFIRDSSGKAVAINILQDEKVVSKGEIKRDSQGRITEIAWYDWNEQWVNNGSTTYMYSSDGSKITVCDKDGINTILEFDHQGLPIRIGDTTFSYTAIEVPLDSKVDAYSNYIVETRLRDYYIGLD